MDIFFKPTEDEIRGGGQKWALIYVAIGIGCWVFGMLQGWSFGIMGQNLAVRIKVLFLRACLRQEMGWHDMPENATGKLMTRLASDTMSIRGAVGDQIGVVVQNLSTVIAAFVIAFTSSWDLTLVVASLLPIMAGAQFVQTLMLTGQFTKVFSVFVYLHTHACVLKVCLTRVQGEDDSVEANQVALEGVRSIKVVNAYSLQQDICARYKKATENSVSVKIIHIAGVAYGFSQFVLYCVICLAFWYGAKGVSKGKMDFQDLMKVRFVLCLFAFVAFIIALHPLSHPTHLHTHIHTHKYTGLLCALLCHILARPSQCSVP